MFVCVCVYVERVCDVHARMSILFVRGREVCLCV